MRIWPWKKDYDWDYEPTGKSKRQPQSLKNVAEKILARKMKSDPDGYGLEISERLLKVAPVTPRTLKEQLEELTELRTILSELGGSSEGGGLTGLVSSLINSDLGAQLGSMIAGAANRPQIDVPPRREALSPPPAPMPEPDQQQNTIHLGDLLALIGMSPPECVENLDQAWINTLAKLSYPQVVGQLMPFIDDETYGSLVVEILSEERKGWVQELLRLCQSAASEA